MAGSGALTALIIFSLLFSSATISYFVVEMKIDATIKDLPLPNIAAGSFSSNQNFLTMLFNNEVLTSKETTWINTLGKGQQISGGGGFQLINSINFDSNNEIKNTYTISNPDMADYAIVVVHDSLPSGTIIKVTNDGFYITSSMSPLIRYREFIKYNWASKFTHPTITTTYNKITNTVYFTLNSASFSSNQVTPVTGIGEDVGIFEKYYAGVYTDNANFAWEQFTTNNNINGDGTYNPITLAIDFFKTMLLIVAWSLPESIFPLILNVILIKSQLVALLLVLSFGRVVNMIDEKSFQHREYKLAGIGVGILLIFISIFLCVYPVEAKTETVNSTLEVTGVTEDSITWYYTYLTDLRPIGATLNGVIIEGWKNDLVYNYTANNLNPDSEYTFCLFGEITSNCETAKTLTKAKPVLDNILDLIWLYIFIIIASIFIILGLMESYFSFIGFIFACLGLSSELIHTDNSIYMMSIYGILIVISIFVAFNKGE